MGEVDSSRCLENGSHDEVVFNAVNAVGQHDSRRCVVNPHNGIVWVWVDQLVLDQSAVVVGRDYWVLD